MKTKRLINQLLFITFVVINFSFVIRNNNNVMRKTSNNTYIINTSTIISHNIKGFKGATPLEVYIKNNKIIKIVPLPNNETPKFFTKVKSIMLPKFNNKKLSNIHNIDGVTGATYSSKAVKANIEAAIDYYKKHK